jgi:hypothetical protein
MVEANSHTTVDPDGVFLAIYLNVLYAMKFA